MKQQKTIRTMSALLLVTTLLSLVTLCGCTAPAVVPLEPNADTLSQGVRLHDIFGEDSQKFEWSYEKSEDKDDNCPMTPTSGTSLVPNLRISNWL